jgi:hypothetical protein
LWRLRGERGLLGVQNAYQALCRAEAEALAHRDVVRQEIAGDGLRKVGVCGVDGNDVDETGGVVDTHDIRLDALEGHQHQECGGGDDRAGPSAPRGPPGNAGRAMRLPDAIGIPGCGFTEV